MDIRRIHYVEIRLPAADRCSLRHDYAPLVPKRCFGIGKYCHKFDGGETKTIQMSQMIEQASKTAPAAFAGPDDGGLSFRFGLDRDGRLRYVLTDAELFESSPTVGEQASLGNHVMTTV